MSAKRVHTQANKADCLVGEAGRVVRLAVGVTGDHAQTLREGLDRLVLRAITDQVVDVEAGFCGMTCQHTANDDTHRT